METGAGARGDSGALKERDPGTAARLAASVTASDTLRAVRRLGPGGGTLIIPGTAVARFGSGVLARTTDVTLAATRTAETARDWETTSPVEPGRRLAWELRITVGAEPPAGPVEVQVMLAPGLQPARHAVVPFAQVYQRSADELHDGFVRIEATTAGDTIRFMLGAEAFTGERRADRMHEAVVVLAAVP